MRRRIRWIIFSLLLLGMMVTAVGAAQNPRVVSLVTGDVMWVECEGGDLPLSVLDGPGNAIGVVCRKGTQHGVD